METLEELIVVLSSMTEELECCMYLVDEKLERGRMKREVVEMRNWDNGIEGDLVEVKGGYGKIVGVKGDEYRVRIGKEEVKIRKGDILSLYKLYIPMG